MTTAKLDVFRRETLVYDYNCALVLKQHRVKANLSIESVAAELGVSMACIVRLEDGTQHCSFGEYMVLAHNYGFDPAKLVLAIYDRPDPDEQTIADLLKQGAESVER